MWPGLGRGHGKREGPEVIYFDRLEMKQRLYYREGPQKSSRTLLWDRRRWTLSWGLGGLVFREDKPWSCPKGRT